MRLKPVRKGLLRLNRSDFDLRALGCIRFGLGALDLETRLRLGVTRGFMRFRLRVV